MIRLALAIALFVPSLALAQESGEPMRLAIVVGHNASDREELPDLRYADDDAIATHQLLTQAGVESTLLVAMDRDTERLNPNLAQTPVPNRQNLAATLATVRKRIRTLNDQGNKTEFLFVYSGHGGLEHGEGYVVLADGPFTRRDLHEEVLRPSPATQNQVIIDACKSFFVVFERGAGGSRSFYPGNYVKDAKSSLFANTGFILSTSSDRDSHEWEKYQAGVFSHEVRSGLWGAADANGDGRVTYAELGAFLSVANEAIPNPRYRPDFVVRPPGAPDAELGHTVIAWPSNKSALLLDDQKAGHIYVETARGQRVMDVNVVTAEPLMVQLPEERPLFVRPQDSTREYQIDRVAPMQLSMLTATERTLGTRGARHLAFEELFKVPFGQKAVDKYTECYALFGDPLRLDALEHFTLLERLNTIETAAFWTGAVALGTGMSANVWAQALSSSSGSSSHDDRVSHNDTINQLNTVALGAYAVAGAAAMTYAISYFWPVDPLQTLPTLSLSPTVTPEGAGVSLTVRH